MTKELINKLNGYDVDITAYYPDSDDPEKEDMFGVGVLYKIEDGKIVNYNDPYDSYDLKPFRVNKRSIAKGLCMELIDFAFNNCSVYEELCDAEVKLYCIIRHPETDNIIDEKEVDPISWWI